MIMTPPIKYVYIIIRPKEIKYKKCIYVMDTKEELIKHIRGWIQIDNDMNLLQKKMKTLV